MPYGLRCVTSDRRALHAGGRLPAQALAVIIGFNRRWRGASSRKNGFKYLSKMGTPHDPRPNLVPMLPLSAVCDRTKHGGDGGIQRRADDTIRQVASTCHHSLRDSMVGYILPNVP